MSTHTAASIVEGCEQHLLTHPRFGDSDKILRRAFERYRFGLEVFCDFIPSITPAVEVLASNDHALATLQKDPLAAFLIEAAFARLELGTLTADHPLAVHLASFVDAVLEGDFAGPTEQLMDPLLHIENEQSWFWALPDEPGNYGSSLQQMLAQSFETSLDKLQLVRANEEIKAHTDRALELLEILVPNLKSDVLRHMASICIGESDTFLSLSGGDALPATIVNATPERLANTWEYAELILHECLHLKLLNVARISALVRDHDAIIYNTWRKSDWNVTRNVFAFHVYAHLVVFQEAVENNKHLYGEFGIPVPPEKIEYSLRHKAIERSKILYGMLNDHRDKLTMEGCEFVQWQADAISPLCKLQ